MGQYCFARCRLSATVVCRRLLESVTLPAAGRGPTAAAGPAARRVGGSTADTARRASTVTSR